MSEQLHNHITRLILEQIDAGNIDREQVKQIIVGLSRDCQSINIWQHEEWENYDDHSDEQAIAEIDNRDWVAQLDKIGHSTQSIPNQKNSPSYMPDLGFSFTHEAHQQEFLELLSKKITEICEALKQITREQLLGDFSQLVGLMGQKISNSNYADLVCIYHPQGVDVLPASDRPLPGYNSLYGYMSLVDDGVILFYTNKNKMEEKTRHYLFSDMDFFKIENDEVVFQLTNGLQFELDAGHTQEETGGLGSKQIVERLIDHFKTHLPNIYFDIDSPPAMNDLAAWHQWQNLFEKYFRKELSGAVSSCLQKGGLGQANAFLTAIEISPKEITKANVSYFPYCLTQELYDELLQCFDSCDADDLGSYDWSCVYRALIIQDQLQKIIEISQKKLSTKLKDYESVVHVSYYVIACIHLGKQEDFVSMLNATSSGYRRVAFYVAKLLASSDDQLICFSNILNDNDYSLAYAEKDFSSKPELLSQLRFYFELRNNTCFLDAELKQNFCEPTEKSPALDFETVFGQRWVSEPVTMLQQISDTPLLHPVENGFFIGGEHWVRLKQGFARMQVKGSECNQTQLFESENYYRALDKVGNTLYAITKSALEIFSCVDDAKPEPLSVTFSLIEDLNCVSVSNGIAVVGNGKKLSVLNVANAQSPLLLSCISLTQFVDRYVKCSCLLIRNQWLYLGFDRQGVCLVNLTDPTKPQITGFVPCNFSIDVMDEAHNIILAGGREGIIAIDLRESQFPKLIDSLSLDVDYFYQVAPMSFIGGGNTSWCGVQFQSSTKKLALDIWPLFDSHYGQKAIIPHQNGFFICEDNAIDLQFVAESALAFPAGAEAIEKTANWVRKLLAQYQLASSDPLGCINVAIYPGGLELSLLPQMSLPSIGYSSGEKISWNDLWGIPELGDSYKESWRANTLLLQLRDFFSAALIQVAQSEFTHLIAGQCYISLGLIDRVTSQIINEGEWNPARREIQGVIEVPLAVRLEDFNRWESYARKCDSDAELKQELYALAKEGYPKALQVVRRRFKQDEDDSIAVMLFVIEEYSSFFWLDFIEEYAHRQDVKEVCGRLYDRLIQSLSTTDEKNLLQWAGGLIQVAIMLGKQNLPKIDPLISKLLFAPKVDYSHYDLATKLLSSKKDVRPFADIIQRAINAMEPRDNRLPDLAEQLYRAGVFEVPAGLIQQSTPEKRGEQYDSIKLGIEFLDKTSEYNQCRIERLFTGKMLLDNFRQGVSAEQSLWPESVAAEPQPESWAYLLKSVLLRMDLEAELPAFIQALGPRLHHPVDRAIFTALFKALVESKDQSGYLQPMINLVKALPNNEDWADLHKIRQNTEANLAWQANGEGNVEVSKEITQRLLAEGYESAYLFFLEARLAWKETGDPAVAVKLALPRLKGLHGGSAKAHFINLVGCAYDALGQFDEALALFKQAADMNPEMVIYFDNIAEIYDKMGDAEKALHSALDAKRRGSKAAIVETIIKKYQPSHSDS